MPATTADRLISRITALHKSLQLDEAGHVSSMERDLMLTYLRQLYEIYASGAVAPPAPMADKDLVMNTPPPPAPTPIRPAPAAAPYSSAPASVQAPPSVGVPPTPPEPAPAMVTEIRQPEPEVYRTERDVPAPPSPPRQEERAPAVPDAPVPPPPAPAMTEHVAVVEPAAPTKTKPPIKPEPPKASDKPAPKPAATPAPPKAQPTPSDDKAMRALFEDRGSSSRFGRQPVGDLTRALSINNRILFTRDLFGGDNGLLNTTLQQFNTLSDFDEARPLITSFARRFDWLDEGKQEPVQEFIELIRRRYV